jgi:hypothetical protein
MTNRVTCINKTDRYNPWERIRHLGGTKDGGGQWGCSQQECVSYIESGYTFYVQQGQNKVYLEVAVSPEGNKYVKTKADRTPQDNLLSLPECP